MTKFNILSHFVKVFHQTDLTIQYFLNTLNTARELCTKSTITANDRRPQTSKGDRADVFIFYCDATITAPKNVTKSRAPPTQELQSVLCNLSPRKHFVTVTGKIDLHAWLRFGSARMSEFCPTDRSKRLTFVLGDDVQPL